MVLVIITSHFEKRKGAHTATNRTIEINEKAASMAFIFLSLFPHFLRTAYKALRITVQWNTYQTKEI
jgi:hypothetical protein